MSDTISTPPPTIQDPLLDHRDDLTAIRRVIANIEAGFNRKDATLAVQHFAANASAVSVAGVRTAGREALFEAHAQAFEGPLNDQYARYELADVTFLSPDVALAYKHAYAADADGAQLEADHAMIALYVLTKRAGRWWVVARQNTLTAPRG